jgi:hypothetical protein
MATEKQIAYINNLIDLSNNTVSRSSSPRDWMIHMLNIDDEDEKGDMIPTAKIMEQFKARIAELKARDWSRASNAECSAAIENLKSQRLVW